MHDIKNYFSMKQIIECVPNFSEGRDLSVIKQITDVIEGVPGIRLLNVDPGYATNRTVVTFIALTGNVIREEKADPAANLKRRGSWRR